MHRLAHVVHADNLNAAFMIPCNAAAAEPACRRAATFSPVTAPIKPFRDAPSSSGITKTMKQAHALQQIEIVLERLAKADARIGNDLAA
jgi:hypothetical protein